jgi:hypothetical protein
MHTHEQRIAAEGHMSSRGQGSGVGDVRVAQLAWRRWN